MLRGPRHRPHRLPMTVPLVGEPPGPEHAWLHGPHRGWASRSRQEGPHRIQRGPPRSTALRPQLAPESCRWTTRRSDSLPAPRSLRGAQEHLTEGCTSRGASHLVPASDRSRAQPRRGTRGGRSSGRERTARRLTHRDRATAVSPLKNTHLIMPAQNDTLTPLERVTTGYTVTFAVRSFRGRREALWYSNCSSRHDAP